MDGPSPNHVVPITFILKSIFVWYNERTQLGLGIAPKIWTYVGNDNQTNPDLSAYRGYFQVDIRAGKADGLVIGTDLRWAKEGGSIQADLTYPISQFLGDNLDIYLQLQYVNALAESLIDYQSRTEAFRIGFAIVRWRSAAEPVLSQKTSLTFLFMR